jgi:peptidoglycan-associated lipoprotein
MKKWHYLILVPTILGFAACSNPPVKKQELKSTPRTPPPIFKSTAAAMMPTAATTTEKADSEKKEAGDIPTKRIIYFDYDISEIRQEDRMILEEHAAYLSKNPTVPMSFEGHADERGSREYNLALGERRAMGAKAFIMNLGVPESQLTTMSYGEERPVKFGHDESSWWENRRVELIYP